MSAVIFQDCLRNEHLLCLEWGAQPTTVGQERVRCCCTCHTDGSNPSLPVEFVDVLRDPNAVLPGDLEAMEKVADWMQKQDIDGWKESQKLTKFYSAESWSRCSKCPIERVLMEWWFQLNWTTADWSERHDYRNL